MKEIFALISASLLFSLVIFASKSERELTEKVLADIERDGAKVSIFDVIAIARDDDDLNTRQKILEEDFDY